MNGIESVVAGGVPVGFRVTWDRIVPGLESIPADMVPLDDATHDLGTTTERFAEAHISSFVAVGDGVAQSGALRLGNQGYIKWRNNADDGDVGMTVDANDRFRFEATLRPDASDTYDLGRDTLRWRDAYLSGVLATGCTDGITASTTQTQGQQPLTKSVNRVSVCANANDVVTLPAALIGLMCAVRNDGANTLQIFPASGDDINGGATDASIALAAGSALILFAIDATSWYSFGAL